MTTSSSGSQQPPEDQHHQGITSHSSPWCTTLVTPGCTRTQTLVSSVHIIRSYLSFISFFHIILSYHSSPPQKAFSLSLGSQWLFCSISKTSFGFACQQVPCSLFQAVQPIFIKPLRRVVIAFHVHLVPQEFFLFLYLLYCSFIASHRNFSISAPFKKVSHFYHQPSFDRVLRTFN